MTERLIKQAGNNKERQETYRYQMGRYKTAIRNEFYFEALIIVYALLEDRLKAFLYYCGFITNRNELKICKKIKQEVNVIMKGEMPDARSLRSIQNKISCVRNILEWSEAVYTKDIAENEYYICLKSQIECIDVGGMLDVLADLSREKTGWLAYRNEVIHASMNKNVHALYENLSEQVEKGMECARFIDNQVKILKNKAKVRKVLKLQNN